MSKIRPAGFESDVFGVGLGVEAFAPAVALGLAAVERGSFVDAFVGTLGVSTGPFGMTFS